MILVNKVDFEKLQSAGILNNSKMSKDFKIVNKNKKSCRKKYYVSETARVLEFLRNNA